MGLKTPEKIGKLQRTLYAKAKEQPERRFHQLYDKVWREDFLEFAYRKCKANGGAAGVDREGFEDIEARGREKWLGELARELKSKSYRPAAVRRVWIDKTNGGKRPLGVPTIKDRVVQTAAMLVIEPIFEADLQPEQHGYRPRRSAQDAVQAVHALINTGHREVVDADLSGYFDSIPRKELMQSVARRICDRQMLKLIKMWLNTPVVEDSKKGKDEPKGGGKRGTPQGSPISPLLANLYFRRFIMGWRKLGPKQCQGRIVSYADDFVICCQGEAGKALQATREILGRLGLERDQDLCETAAGRELGLSGLHTGDLSSSEKRGSLPGDSTFEEVDRQDLSRNPQGDAALEWAQVTRARGGPSEPNVGGMGQLLLLGWGQQSLSGGGCPHPMDASSVVATKTQEARQQGNAAVPGPVPVRKVGAGTTDRADSRPSVGESVRPCPRAGCGKIARPVRRAGCGNGAWTS